MSPSFIKDERVYVLPLQTEANVIQQRVFFDDGEPMLGNVEIMFDDGIIGICHSWQLKKLRNSNGNSI